MNKTIVALIIGIIGVMVSPTRADSNNVSRLTKEASILAPLVIQNQGRLKPMGTFAKFSLLAARQKSSIYRGAEMDEKMSAMAWLSELLLRPERSTERHFFKVPYPNAIEALGIEPRVPSPSISSKKAHLYNYQELREGFVNHIGEDLQNWAQKEKKDRSIVQEQILQLYHVMGSTYSISTSLSLFKRDISIENKELAALFQLKPNEKSSFLHFHRHRSTLRKEVTGLMGRKGQERRQIDDDLIRLVSHLSQRMHDQNSTPLAIIPPSPGSSSELWRSPWQATSLDNIDDWTWQRLDQLQLLFDQLDDNLYDEAQATAQSYMDAVGHRDHIDLELKYNERDDFTKSLVYYGVSLISLMLSWMLFPRALWWISVLCMIVGLAQHGLGLISRMIIMQRPPVTTLYESIIFVGFIAVLLCTILEVIRRNGLGIFAGTTLGSLLHFVGFSYADDGDTMGMLVAVLNSNFWLATHVVTITVGYGATVVAGLAGHLYLFKAIFFAHQKKELQEINKNAIGLSLVALFFSTLGTILGGIWGDQSWGRFWGWDPKENGALLIVLWLLMLLHGRISGITKPLSFNAGLIVANTIVALAWFGVNLLGVGLHSYGFTDSIAGNLSLFCRIEIILAAVFYFWASHRQNKGIINIKLFTLNLILPFVWIGLNLSGITLPYWGTNELLQSQTGRCHAEHLRGGPPYLHPRLYGLLSIHKRTGTRHQNLALTAVVTLPSDTTAVMPTALTLKLR